MATEFVIYLPSHAAASEIDAATDALDILEPLETKLTVYDPESEICRVNRFAGANPTRVSIDTFSIVETALRWSVKTTGAIDVTAGPLVDAWGICGQTGRKPTADEISAATRLVNYQNVAMDPLLRTIALAQSGMKLNLGSIGKGFALDKMAAKLRAADVEHFLIHGGASSVIAVGHEDPAVGLGWTVGIAHPTRPRHQIGRLQLIDAAIATSGSGRQYFHHQGRRYGHVIDPRSGYPAGDLLSMTVVMPSATDADAVATALFVMSSQQRESNEQAELWYPPTIEVAAGKRQNEVGVRVAGTLDWQLAAQP